MQGVDPCFSVCERDNNVLTGVDVTRATFHEAAAECEAHGARLCTREELPVCCGTGCSADTKLIWTSSTCDDSEMVHHQGRKLEEDSERVGTRRKLGHTRLPYGPSLEAVASPWHPATSTSTASAWHPGLEPRHPGLQGLATSGAQVPSRVGAGGRGSAGSDSHVQSVTSPVNCLTISGLIDGPGGGPRAVELYAHCHVTELAEYGLSQVRPGDDHAVIHTPMCCWSRWGDTSTCGDHGAMHRAGTLGASPPACNTDWGRACNWDSDCPAQPGGSAQRAQGLGINLESPDGVLRGAPAFRFPPGYVAKGSFLYVARGTNGGAAKFERYFDFDAECEAFRSPQAELRWPRVCDYSRPVFTTARHNAAPVTHTSLQLDGDDALQLCAPAPPAPTTPKLPLLGCSTT